MTKQPIGDFEAQIVTEAGLLARIYGKTQEEAESNRIRFILAVNAVAGIEANVLQKGIVQSLLSLAAITENYLDTISKLFPDKTETTKKVLSNLVETLPIPKEPSDE